MRTKEEVKTAILASNIRKYGFYGLYELEEDDFQEICSLTREYAHLCGADDFIDKETAGAFVSILNAIWGKSIDIKSGYMDQENLTRGSNYWSLLVNEVFPLKGR